MLFFVSEQLQETRVEEKSTMNFVLMVRKGHKQQYKSLAVPINSELALNLKNREEVGALIVCIKCFICECKFMLPTQLTEL